MVMSHGDGEHEACRRGEPDVIELSERYLMGPGQRSGSGSWLLWEGFKQSCDMRCQFSKVPLIALWGVSGT